MRTKKIGPFVDPILNKNCDLIPLKNYAYFEFILIVGFFILHMEKE